MPLSIVTVTYNSEKYLRHTMDSILSQSFSDIEYIIVDGASTDQTIKIIQEYEPKFNGRMKWISEPDDGLYDALNKGIRAASGEIVGILNSDDFFTSPAVLSEIAEAFENNVCDAVYGDVHYVRAENLNKCVRYYSSAGFKPRLMKIGLMPAHPTFYVRRKLFDELGYYRTDYKIAADFELLLRFIYIHKIGIRYIPTDFVTMRTGGLSTGSMNSRIRIMKEHLRAFRENAVSCNCFRLSLRYPVKIMELLKAKFQNTFLANNNPV